MIEVIVCRETLVLNPSVSLGFGLGAQIPRAPLRLARAEPQPSEPSEPEPKSALEPLGAGREEGGPSHLSPYAI